VEIIGKAKPYRRVLNEQQSFGHESCLASRAPSAIPAAFSAMKVLTVTLSKMDRKLLILIGVSGLFSCTVVPRLRGMCNCVVKRNLTQSIFP
jgi:hypothetical protein